MLLLFDVSKRDSEELEIDGMVEDKSLVFNAEYWLVSGNGNGSQNSMKFAASIFLLLLDTSKRDSEELETDVEIGDKSSCVNQSGLVSKSNVSSSRDKSSFNAFVSSSTSQPGLVSKSIMSLSKELVKRGYQLFMAFNLSAPL